MTRPRSYSRSRRYGFGDSAPAAGATRVLDVGTQEKALVTLGNLARRATVDPYVRGVAMKIIEECASRDDACELYAIYDAVKHGNPNVPPLTRGIKYVADPRYADYFTSPIDTLKNAEKGANGGDCLPGDTLLLGASWQTFPIKSAQVGDLVYSGGLNQWVKITQTWDKGVQRVLGFMLRGGGMLKCTPEHRVFTLGSPFRPCSEAVEVCASELKLGDHLLTGVLPADYIESFAKRFGREPTPRGETAVRIDGIIELKSQQTYDIEVEGHRFYLPETDLVVHNCDDHSSLICALAGAVGWKVGLRAWGPKGMGGFVHVYPIVAYPKRPRPVQHNGMQYGLYDVAYGMDTTVPDATVGWEPPPGDVLSCWLD